MPRGDGPDTALAHRQQDRLRALALDPPAQAQYAAELIETAANPDVLLGAALALGRSPVPRAHAAVMARVASLMPPSRRDVGGGIRAALLRAARSTATVEDIPLLDAIISGRESGYHGPASDLRAAALAALNVPDPGLAAFHAVRLLHRADDPLATSQESGEPAITAVRLLSGSGHQEAIFTAVVRKWRPPSEVLAEALRQLDGLPGSMLAEVVIDCSHRDTVVQLGLCDLVVAHPAGGGVTAMLFSAIADNDVLSYLAAAIVASHRPPLLAALLAEGRRAPDARRLGVIVEALQLAAEPAAREALPGLQERLRVLPAGPPPDHRRLEPPGEDGGEDG
jgi:hypothetical protein